MLGQRTRRLDPRDISPQIRTQCHQVGLGRNVVIDGVEDRRRDTFGLAALDIPASSIAWANANRSAAIGHNPFSNSRWIATRNLPHGS